jgi:glycosyltransferase involved in cell wall biosynthesis
MRVQGLTNHVVFPGPRYGENKIREFAEAGIFVLPSYSEGLSNALLEALAAGLPVVATNVGALPEGVVEGLNGYLVGPGDWKDLGARISALISDPELRRRMGRASRALCEEKFRLDEFVTCLAKLLQSAASETPLER